MWLMATMDGATLAYLWVSFREFVSPLKWVANVCVYAQYAFFNERVCSFIWFSEALLIPQGFTEKCQISQSWIPWYLNVGIAVLGGVPLPMDLQHSGGLWFWARKCGCQMHERRNPGLAERQGKPSQERGHYLQFANQYFSQIYFTIHC